MASISIHFGANDAYTITLAWSETAQSVENNQTTLAITCTLYSNRASATFTGQARSDTLTVGGSTYTCNHGNYTVPGGGSVLLWSISPTVTHDANGTHSGPISCAVAIDTTFSSSGYIGTLTLSGTLTLTTIPRASTLSFGSFTAGSAGKITIRAASDSFIHDLSFTFGGVGGTIASGVRDSVSWTPDLSLLNEIPNATSGTGTLTCKTRSGGTEIGTETASFTLYAPDSVRPSVTAFSVSVVNDNAAAADWDVAIRILSKLHWTVSAEGAYGSSVKACDLSFGGVTGSGTSGTTTVLPSAGSFQPTVTVRDSRGRTVTQTLPAVEVLDYALPVIKTASAFRCDADGTASDQGTCCCLRLTASCASVGGRNSLSLRYRYKTAAGSLSAWAALTSGTVLSGFALDQSYTVELQAVDSLGSARTVSIAVPTASAALHIREGGKGAAFGRYAEQDNLLDVAWDLRVAGSATIGGLPPVRGKLLLTRQAGWASGETVSLPELANYDAALVFYCAGTVWSTGVLRHALIPVGSAGTLESIVNMTSASVLAVCQRQLTVGSGAVTSGEVWIKPVNSDSAAADSTSYPDALSPYRIYGLKW